MKKIVSLFLMMLISVPNYSFESFPIAKVTESSYREGVFSLESYPQVKVTLDCASFLHGIEVKAPGRNNFLMLYESECYFIYSSLKSWSEAGESGCLKIDFTKKDWDLKKSTYDCQ